MATVNVAAEGDVDAVAAHRLLLRAGHAAGQVVVKNGKTELDAFATHFRVRPGIQHRFGTAA